MPTFSASGPSSPSNRMTMASARVAKSRRFQRARPYFPQKCEAIRWFDVANSERLRARRFWKDPQGEFGQDRECSKRAADKFRDVEAGDVLDHLAAGFEGFAQSVDGAKSEQLIAHRAVAHTRRAAGIGRDRAGDRSDCGLRPNSGPQSGGSKPSRCPFSASAISISTTGVPGKTVMMSSSGS